MDETRRSLIKGMLTGGTLLAFGIPTVTQAVSLSQTLSGGTRNCRLLLGNTPIDEAFAKGAQAACTRYSSFNQEGELPVFQLVDELLTNPLHIADLLTQPVNMRWIAIMDYANAAIFTELVRNSERHLLALGSHMFASSDNTFLPQRHVWTTASPAYSAGGLLASLLTQNQHDFLYGRLPVWQAIFRVLVKIKSAAVLYPALLQTRFLSAGPDGIRQERSHLLVVLEALEIMQAYVLAVRPVSPSHGFIYLRNLSAFHSFSVVVLCYVGTWLT